MRFLNVAHKISDYGARYVYKCEQCVAERCFGKEDSLQFVTKHMEVPFCGHFCGLLFCRLST